MEREIDELDDQMSVSSTEVEEYVPEQATIWYLNLAGGRAEALSV